MRGGRPAWGRGGQSRPSASPAEPGMLQGGAAQQGQPSSVSRSSASGPTKEAWGPQEEVGKAGRCVFLARAPSDSGERVHSPGKCRVHRVLKVPLSQTAGVRPDEPWWVECCLQRGLTAPHPVHGTYTLSRVRLGGSLVEPSLLLGKLRTRHSESREWGQGGAEKAENKVSAHSEGPLPLLPFSPPAPQSL